MNRVLSALESKDRNALAQLAITKAEFKEYVWPTIASSGDRTSADQFYKQYENGNQFGMSERLRDLGRQKWQFVKVAFGTDAKRSKGIRLLYNPDVTVRDGNRQEKTARIAAGVLEHDGTCKLMPFYVRPQQGAQGAVSASELSKRN